MESMDLHQQLKAHIVEFAHLGNINLHLEKLIVFPVQLAITIRKICKPVAIRNALQVDTPSKALRRVPNVRWGSKLVLQMDTRVVTAEGTVVLVTTEIQQ